MDVSRRIDQGIRMTFLLSFLAMPLSYLTLVILAHTSSEAVGIFNGSSSGPDSRRVFTTSAETP